MNADHTATIAKGYLVDRITVLTPEKVAAICAAASSLTGRPSNTCASTRYRAISTEDPHHVGVSYVLTHVSPIS
jgi:hypothetical protein